MSSMIMNTDFTYVDILKHSSNPRVLSIGRVKTAIHVDEAQPRCVYPTWLSKLSVGFEPE